MNAKITAAVLERIKGKRPDELVSLTLRTNVVLSTEEISLLTALGGTLLYDNGCMAILNLPVGKVDDIAAWSSIVEIR